MAGLGGLGTGTCVTPGRSLPLEAGAKLLSERHDQRGDLEDRSIELDVTVETVTKALSSLAAPQLEGMFPQELNNLRIPTDIFLMHLATHLTYHLGQLDYHRRCVTGDSTAVGTLSLPALLLPFPPLRS